MRPSKHLAFAVLVESIPLRISAIELQALRFVSCCTLIERESPERLTNATPKRWP